MEYLGILIYKEQSQPKMRRCVHREKGDIRRVMSQNLTWQSFKKPEVACNINGAERSNKAITKAWILD